MTNGINWRNIDQSEFWRMTAMDESTRTLLSINATNETFELSDDLTLDEAKMLIGKLVELYFSMEGIKK